ncbi:MAG TPA: dioxygenase [Stellaceae bacterium]|nr:dioxygenase [Stellaceae bacterium]
MSDADEINLTAAVIDSLQRAENPRLKQIMTSLVQHLHGFVRETRPSQEEWAFAIDFLTRTGQMCTAERQEFILLSDTLGVSMLVDRINHEDQDGATDTTVLGPFFVADQPVVPMGSSILKRAEPGEALWLSGVVRDAAGRPAAGARIDVWQTALNGLYDVQDASAPAGHLRAAFVTRADGAYAFETVAPTSYPIPDDGPVGQMLGALGRHPYRPAHIHFMIAHPGSRTLVTHLFAAGDRHLDSDAVFGVKDTLVFTPEAGPEGQRLRYDFGLRAR